MGSESYRFTPEACAETIERHGVRLVNGAFGVAMGEPPDKPIENGCAATLAILWATGNQRETRQIILDVGGSLRSWNTTDIRFPPLYLCGLEHGFENFNTLPSDQQTEVYREGLADGRTIRDANWLKGAN